MGLGISYVESKQKADLYIISQERRRKIVQLTLINAKAKWILAKLGYYLAYAEWRNSAGQLLDSVGYDPLCHVTTLKMSVNELAKKIKYSFRHLPNRDVALKKVELAEK